MGAPSARAYAVAAWTGDRLIVWGGSNVPAVNTGGVYVPPRVAPTIRSAAPSMTPTLTVNQFWRHRITVYGCPRATVTVTGMPSWMSQVYLDTGAFLEGTPGPSDNDWLSVITVTATNGIGNPATQVFHVIVGTAPPAGVFTTPPSVSAQAGVLYTYTPAHSGNPPRTILKTAGPIWLTLTNGTLSGTPPASAGGQSFPVTLTAISPTYPADLQTWILAVDYHTHDITRDAAINVVDVQQCVNLILALAQPAYPNQGDVNSDQAVNVVDIQSIVNRILNP